MAKRRVRANISRTKARQILHDKSVRGHKLTAKQRGMFGAIASGYGPKRKQSRRSKARA